MTVFILGSNGFVGSVLNKYLKAEYKVVRISREVLPGFDIYSEESLLKLIGIFKQEENEFTVINCIALANLDICEEKKAECEYINYIFVKKLVGILNEFSNSKLIHISSNAVYCGNKPLYTEKAKKEPINTYGHFKKCADEYVSSFSLDYCIARPITIYGEREQSDRHNPVTFILDKLANSEPLQLVDDNYVNMLYVGDFAKAITSIIRNNSKGEFNLSGNIIENRYELGLRICDVCGFPRDLISLVSGEHFPVKAKRPYNTSFDNFKMENELGIKITDLNNKIKEIYTSAKF